MDIWTVEERTDWEDGPVAIGPLVRHARRIEVVPETLVVFDILHYSRMHQDWTIGVTLHPADWNAPPRPWFPEVRMLRPARHFWRFVLTGSPDAVAPEDPRFPNPWRADLEAGTWWLVVTNDTGRPDPNSYWWRVLERVAAI